MEPRVRVRLRARSPRTGHGSPAPLHSAGVRAPHCHSSGGYEVSALGEHRAEGLRPPPGLVTETPGILRSSLGSFEGAQPRMSIRTVGPCPQGAPGTNTATPTRAPSRHSMHNCSQLSLSPVSPNLSPLPNAWT